MRSRPTLRAAAIASLAGLCGFAVLTALVDARALARFDLQATIAVQPLVAPWWDATAGVAAVLFASELSIVYAAIGGIALLRAGARAWSVAPLGFLLLYPVELGMKMLVDQPNIPTPLHREVAYPLVEVVLRGTFPSGHALRAAFLCTFAGLLLTPRARTFGLPLAIGIGAMLGIIGFTRVYLGDHWLTDVLGGIALGWSVALPLAVQVERVLMRARPYPGIKQGVAR